MIQIRKLQYQYRNVHVLQLVNTPNTKFHYRYMPTLDFLLHVHIKIHSKEIYILYVVGYLYLPI